jgi:hypothetical protein
VGFEIVLLYPVPDKSASIFVPLLPVPFVIRHLDNTFKVLEIFAVGVLEPDFIATSARFGPALTVTLAGARCEVAVKVLAIVGLEERINGARLRVLRPLLPER